MAGERERRGQQRPEDTYEVRGDVRRGEVLYCYLQLLVLPLYWIRVDAESNSSWRKTWLRLISKVAGCC